MNVGWIIAAIKMVNINRVATPLLKSKVLRESKNLHRRVFKEELAGY